MNRGGKLPKQIRVSLGSAVVLGLAEGKLDAVPTTAYLLTYSRNKCTANCAFCPQARDSQAKADKLSRVTWPRFPTEHVIDGIMNASLRGKIRRVCIQTLNYLGVFDHVSALVQRMSSRVKIPISVSSQPMKSEDMRRLVMVGVERIGIPLDAANRELFDRAKGSVAGGPYTWEKQFAALTSALSVFGKGRVSTHLIVGLGEKEQEMLETIQRCVDMGVLPGLFAFTPVAGTVLGNSSQPPLRSYRRIQIARNLIVQGVAKCQNMSFDSEGHVSSFGIPQQELLKIVQTGAPYITSGCPDCNRPYYNEKPGGPIYNYPRTLTDKELQRAIAESDLG